jgi:predicted MPP superfamily phosphohydrolase
MARSLIGKAVFLGMKRIVWLTDLHLNFLSDDRIDEFLDRVAAQEAAGVIASGDIGESKNVVDYLERFAERVGGPIYFVLGNHDFYCGSIRQVRADVAALCRRDPRLIWLNAVDVVDLAPRWALVGHDGWADARLGDYERSLVMMNDYRLIAEFARMSKQDRWPLLMAEADAAADHIRRVLPEALERHARVLLATHVPPFRNACWHEGQISDDEWLPHFTSKAMGDAIIEIMRDYPERELMVLCGHTHGRGECRPAPNIIVHTGGAQYGAPGIERVLELD